MRKLLLYILLGAFDAVMGQPLDLSRGAWQGAVVIDDATGDMVYGYNEDLRLTPASLTKLFTTAAAIETLGTESRIGTRAYLGDDGKSLTIVGACDPTMDSERFEENSIEAFARNIYKELNRRSALHIANLIIDASYIKGAPFMSKRLWEDMGNYYGATPQAFNVNENRVTFTLSSPTGIGKDCRVVDVSPKIGIETRSYVKSYAKNQDSVYVYGVGDGEWYLSGAMPAGRERFAVRGAMGDAVSVFAGMMRNSLEAMGVKIEEVTICHTAPAMERGEVIATALSPTLAEIIHETNHESINLYADALMLHLSTSEASYDNGMARLRKYVERVTGERCEFYDGSGLSPMNTTTPMQMVTLVRHALHAKGGRAYEASLATAGVDGTLRRLGQGTATQGNVRGKSGSMTGVMGYAGTFRARSGRKMIFSIIINHHQEQNSDVRRKINSWLVNMINNY